MFLLLKELQTSLRELARFLLYSIDMKKIFISILFLFLGIIFYGQELETGENAIPAEKSKIEEEIPLFQTMNLVSPASRMGPFQVDRYKIHFNLIDISFSRDKETSIDILAIARAEEFERKSRIRDFKAPIRQLKQIRSQVQVFGFQSAWGRSNDNRQFDSRLTPDGGIRNEALRDIRQPFINPYPFYGGYGRPYYNDYYYSRPSSLHYYRR